jgi:transposase
MCWRRTTSERKKRQIRRAISGLPKRSTLLVEDETDLLLFPPLRAAWSQRGEAAQVLLSGWNAKRVVFGTMNLVTGHRLFQARWHQRAGDFQAFLHCVHRHYRGWHVTLLLDGDRSHTAAASQELAHRLGIHLLWLPKRAPELNPMDTLWGQAKDVVSSNKQYATIDEQVDLFISYLYSLSNKEALQTSGVLSKRFWLRRVLSKNL